MNKRSWVSLIVLVAVAAVGFRLFEYGISPAVHMHKATTVGTNHSMHCQADGKPVDTYGPLVNTKGLAGVNQQLPQQLAKWVVDDLQKVPVDAQQGYFAEFQKLNPGDKLTTLEPGPGYVPVCKID